jgi:hypothetical protein
MQPHLLPHFEARTNPCCNWDAVGVVLSLVSDQQSRLLAQHSPPTQNPRGIVGRLPRSTCPVPIEIELTTTVEPSESVLATSAKPATCDPQS